MKVTRIHNVIPMGDRKRKKPHINDYKKPPKKPPDGAA